jgi:hypothetical protein
VRRVSDVRQIEIHTAETLVPTPSPFEVETATAKLKNYNLPGSDNILAELIKVGGETLQSEINKLKTSMWCKENLSEQWKKSIVQYYDRIWGTHGTS